LTPRARRRRETGGDRAPVERERVVDLSEVAPDLMPLHPSIREYWSAFWFPELSGGIGDGQSVSLHGVRAGEPDPFIETVYLSVCIAPAT
jgi:hypothetical protein